MATPAEFLAEARDLVSNALYGAPDLGAMVSDYSTGASDSFVAGETKYQIRAWVEQLDEKVDANTRYQTMGVEIQVFHAMQTRTSEPTYTSGAMLDNQFDLLAPETWRDLSSVFEMPENPEISQSPALDQNIISYKLALVARLA